MIGIEEVDASEIRLVLKAMKQIEPDSVKALKTNLKSDLQPIANQIASAMPQAYPQIPSGFFSHNGATAYAPPKGKVSFTPGKGRSGSTSLVSIRMDSGKKRGFYIAELAGSRTKGESQRGVNLVNMLNNRKPMKGKSGRYAYSQFRLMRPDIVRIATDILNKTFSDFERRFS